MEKRMYKFYPDYKLKFAKILTTLGLSTHDEGGWFLKIYENTGWFACGNVFMNLNCMLAWTLMEN